VKISTRSLASSQKHDTVFRSTSIFSPFDYAGKYREYDSSFSEYEKNQSKAMKISIKLKLKEHKEALNSN
jgi:hypothetical protein